jgi:hypothetical protein
MFNAASRWISGASISGAIGARGSVRKLIALGTPIAVRMPEWILSVPGGFCRSLKSGAKSFRDRGCVYLMLQDESSIVGLVWV